MIINLAKTFNDIFSIFYYICKSSFVNGERCKLWLVVHEQLWNMLQNDANASIPIRFFNDHWSNSWKKTSRPNCRTNSTNLYSYSFHYYYSSRTSYCQGWFGFQNWDNIHKFLSPNYNSHFIFLNGEPFTIKSFNIA